MGKSCFIVKLRRDNLQQVVECVASHNATESKPLGESWTAAEYAVLDPMRAAVFSALSESGMGVSATMGPLTKYTRGEDIQPDGCFVKFEGAIWAEFINYGAGSSTTCWLKNHFPNLGWIGTEGKPRGFIEAPAIGDFDNLRSFVVEGRRLLARKRA